MLHPTQVQTTCLWSVCVCVCVWLMRRVLISKCVCVFGPFIPSHGTPPSFRTPSFLTFAEPQCPRVDLRFSCGRKLQMSAAQQWTSPSPNSSDALGSRSLWGRIPRQISPALCHRPMLIPPHLNDACGGRCGKLWLPCANIKIFRFLEQPDDRGPRDGVLPSACRVGSELVCKCLHTSRGSSACARNMCEI